MNITHGNVSFEMPEGFQDETVIAIGKPVDVKNGKQIDPNAYPLNITITKDIIGNAPAPLPYLQLKLGQLKTELEQFKLKFAKEDNIRNYEAAKAQFSFVAYFQLEQLVYVWFEQKQLMTATLSTTSLGVDEGWNVLTKVVESLKFS